MISKNIDLEIYITFLVYTVTYSNLKHFFQDDERRSLLRKLTDEEYKDVIRVLASFPILDVTITTEVVDDEEQHVVTAGAIVTVTLLLERG